MRVARDELGIRPGAIQNPARQCIIACAQLGDLVGCRQVRAGIEYPPIPAPLIRGPGKVHERRDQRQVPGQFRGGARAQPFALPVAPMAPPIDRAHHHDGANLRNRPKSGKRMQRMIAAVPAECERHDRAQHGDRAQ